MSSPKVEPAPTCTQSKVGIPKHLSACPAIAYPTLILALFNFILWVYVEYLCFNNKLSYIYAFPLLSLSVFVAFTPMHDACHGAIATNKSGHRWLNKFVGRLCAFQFTAPFTAFQWIHLQHHKYTNVPTIDPDMWAG